MMKGKTPEEIRKTFNIKNDFTPVRDTAPPVHLKASPHPTPLSPATQEEEAQVREENRWCEEA